jgi:hypothetical protein
VRALCWLPAASLTPGPACLRPAPGAQLSWQLDSSVPGIGLLVRRYAPSDTYHIWKVI